MNGKTNQQEAPRIQVLNALQKPSKDYKEKQYKKQWSEIQIPFTLQEGLSTYPKYELDTIRKSLNIKGASSLKKAELLALLLERIPQHVESMCLSWDHERFQLLAHAASNGGYMSATDVEAKQIEYFRANGLMYTGTFEEQHILALPSELTAQIIAFKQNEQIHKIIARNTEWIKLTVGLLYYYGTLSVTQLVKMLETYAKEALQFTEYMEVIFDANSYREEFYIDGNGFSHSRVFDSKRVKQEQEAREAVPYYPFTKQQLLQAGEPGFVERNESYVQLVNFFIRHFKISKAEADRIVEECVYATQIGENPNNILQFLAHRFELDSMETVQALMDRVVHLMNNTRQWFLKGHTPMELKPDLQRDTFEHSDRTQAAKVGRNEPCSCGSGKKYKKCCGR